MHGEIALLVHLVLLPEHWRVVPIGPDKRPRLRDWPNRAVPRTEYATVKGWLRRWPDAGLALATGPESGVVVIDVDTEKGHGVDGEHALARLERELGPLPETVETKTPTGGRHLFFAWPRGVKRIPSRPLEPGVDIRGSNGLVVLPTGPRTRGRRWTRGPLITLATLPVRWRSHLISPAPRVPSAEVAGPQPFRPAPTANDAYVAAALRSARAEVASAVPGTRHNTLFRAAASLGRLVARGLDPDEAIQELAEAAIGAGLEPDEAWRTARDGVHRSAKIAGR